MRRAGKAAGHGHDGNDAGAGPNEVGAPSKPGDARGLTEKRGVLDDDANDFVESEGDDGEVVAAEPQRWHADEKTSPRRRRHPGAER